MEKEKTINIVGAVVIFFIFLFAYTKLAGPIPFTINNINTNKTSPFEVSGTGKTAAPADIALINLGVTRISSNVLDAQNKTNQASEKIIKALKKLDIPEKNIKTTNYSINPEYSFNGNSQRITGYSVTQSFEVKVPIEKTNEAVDKSTSNGANLVGNIVFTLNDIRKEELENKARKEAVDNAKRKAEGLAKASGIRLGKIINVWQDPGVDRPILFDSEKAVGSPEARTESNITPGETNIEVIITLSYETF